MAPWLQAGKGALGELSGLTSKPGQGLLTPWTQQFQAPTNITEQNDPGYQFRLQQGMQALNNSAAAKGNLLSGNTLEAQQQFGENYASNEYNNTYNRALQQYQQNYGIFENNQANEYNRLAGLAGTGQTAASTLGQEGQAAASNIGNTYLTSAAQQGQSLQNAGAATASGYIGGANAWSGGLSGATNSLTQGIMLNQLMGHSNPTAGIDLNSIQGVGITPAYFPKY